MSVITISYNYIKKEFNFTWYGNNFDDSILADKAARVWINRSCNKTLNALETL